MKITSVTKTGQKKSIAAPAGLFAERVNWSLLSQAVRVYRSNLRQGTSKVQTRSEVSRTKRKWYRQKGTGNARHGARSANIFVGGGVVHGPTGEQNWSRSLSQTQKRAALKAALTAQAEAIYVANHAADLSGKTKEAHELVSKVTEPNSKVLVVLADRNETAERSLRNLDRVLVTTAHLVNALDVASADAVITTADALKNLSDRVEGKTKAAPAAKAKPAVKTEKKPVAKKAAPKKS